MTYDEHVTLIATLLPGDDWGDRLALAHKIAHAVKLAEKVKALEFYRDGFEKNSTVVSILGEPVQIVPTPALINDQGETAYDALEPQEVTGDAATLAAAHRQITSTALRVYLKYAALVKVAAKACEAVEALIDETLGVEGLHDNGDLASWDDLTKGGDYEEWLAPLDDLSTMLDDLKKTAASADKESDDDETERS